jgi:hypothetical protein
MGRRIAIVCVMCVTVAASGAEPTWERVFPTLPDVRSVVWYDAPSTWWVTSLVEGEGMALLRTPDDGATWHTVAEGVGRDHLDKPWLLPKWTYAVHRANPNILYRTGAGIDRSDDGGVTWNETTFEPIADWALVRPNSESHITVSPTDPDRIAYVVESGMVGGGPTVRDLITGETAQVRRWGSLWTHPKTGRVYWRASQGFGAVDFGDLSLSNFGGWHDQYGGVGFMSDDPVTLLQTTSPMSTGPVSVRPNGAAPTYTFTGTVDFMAEPGSVAVDVETGDFFLAGRTRVGEVEYDEAVITSRDGEHWAQVADTTGQLYFLSDRAGVFLQTENDLLRLAVPTSVSAAGKASTTWAALKE